MGVPQSFQWRRVLSATPSQFVFQLACIQRFFLLPCELDLDGGHDQFQTDARFLCSDRRMDAELVDRLVLQLNRIHPQILSDKEAYRVTMALRTTWRLICQKCVWPRASRFILTCVSVQFRKLSVPTKKRLAELLKHLHRKGEDACDEFYRGLHIHAEDVYTSLPTRVTQRGIRWGKPYCQIYLDQHERLSVKYRETLN